MADVGGGGGRSVRAGGVPYLIPLLYYCRSAVEPLGEGMVGTRGCYVQGHIACGRGVVRGTRRGWRTSPHS